MSDKRKQENFEKLVGRKDDKYYVLNYVFDDRRHGDKPFRGATGTVIRPITIAEYNSRQEPEAVREYMAELWQQCVAADTTELGLDDWIEQLGQDEIEDTIFDLSASLAADMLVALLNRRKAKKLGVLIGDLEDEDRYEYCENTGCGRIFHHNDKWDEVFDQKLLDLIAEYEQD